MARLPAPETTRDVSPGEIEPVGVPRLVPMALTVVLALEGIRVLFPLAYRLGERTSFLSAGYLAFAIFLAPFLAPAIRRWLGVRTALLAAVGGAAAARVAVQFVRPVPLPLAVVETGLALLALSLWYERLRANSGDHGGTFVVALIVGMAVDAALLGLFGTWEPSWQDGPGPVVAAAAVVIALLASTWAASRLPRPAVPLGPVSAGIWTPAAVGPFLMLHVLFLQNVAFTASATTFHLPAALAVVLAGDLAAVVAVVWTRGRPVPLSARVAAGAVLVVLAALLNEGSGPMAAIVIPLAHVPAAVLLSEALVRPDFRGSWRAGVGMGLASIGFLLLTFLFYVHYEIPLPFPNVVLAPMAAALLAVAGLREAPLAVRPPRWPAVVPASLLIVPVVLALVYPAPVPSVVEARTFRLVDYNVHTAVDVEGQLDPEGIADVIEGQHPDVVVLQEVSRGWAVAGSIDAAEWLGRRLHMPYVYSEAADKGFGNAVLSRIPILDSDIGFLPTGSGPMDRSWVRVVLDLGGGRTVTVIGSHLHHRHRVPGDDATRLQQVGALLGVWGGGPQTVIAGDMNARPGSEEIERFRAAGFRPAGDLRITTSIDPRERIDYILGTSDIGFSDVTVPESAASDHLAVAATVSAG